MGKLTLDLLLNRKSKQDKISLSTLYIDSLEAEIEIMKIKTRKVCEIMDKYDIQDAKILSSYDMMCELIYKSVPLLQKEDLKSQLNIPTPYEIVSELFDFYEMQTISEHILKLHNLYDSNIKQVNEEIKN